MKKQEICCFSALDFADAVMGDDPTSSDADTYTEIDDEDMAAATQGDWKSATVATLDQTRDRAKQVQEAVQRLEQQEAERLAAERAERKRQKLLADAAEKKRKEEIEAERERNFKRFQAEELMRQQNALRQRKKAESVALQAATANFKKMTLAENAAREKDTVKTNLNDISTKVLEGVLECQHLISKLWGDLMLCEKRRKLRENRPPAELFKDYVDESLEKEWQSLTSSRQELNTLVTAGNHIRCELQAIYSQLNTKRSRGKITSKMTRPSSAPLLLPALEQLVSSENDSLLKARTLIGEASKLATQSKSARSRIRSECDLAAAHVNACLDRRKAELGKLIRELQDQKTNAEKTACDAEKRMVRLKRVILRSCPTSTSTNSDSPTTDDQLTSADSLLLDLWSLKEALEADLSNKYHALKIDESCRQFTKIRAGGHVSRKSELSARKVAKHVSSPCMDDAQSPMQRAG